LTATPPANRLLSLNVFTPAFRCSAPVTALIAFAVIYFAVDGRRLTPVLVLGTNADPRPPNIALVYPLYRKRIFLRTWPAHDILI